MNAVAEGHHRLDAGIARTERPGHLQRRISDELRKGPFSSHRRSGRGAPRALAVPNPATIDGADQRTW